MDWKHLEKDPPRGGRAGLGGAAAKKAAPRAPRRDRRRKRLAGAGVARPATMSPRSISRAVSTPAAAVIPSRITMAIICPSTALAPTSCSRRMCSSTSRTCRSSRPSCCASSNPMVSRCISCRRPVGGFGPRRRTTLGWPRNWLVAWRAERVPGRHPVREPPPRVRSSRTRASAASQERTLSRAPRRDRQYGQPSFYVSSRHRWTKAVRGDGLADRSLRHQWPRLHGAQPRGWCARPSLPPSDEPRAR